jgi:hypothetical protein
MALSGSSLRLEKMCALKTTPAARLIGKISFILKNFRMVPAAGGGEREIACPYGRGGADESG